MRSPTRSTTFRTLALASTLASAGCARSAPVTRMAAGEVVPSPIAGAWRPGPCRLCEEARISVELRESLRPDGSAGSYVVARVRNLNPHAVVLAVDFTEAGYGDGDGVRRHEPHYLHLAAAGDADAERIIVPRLRAIGAVVLSGVERF